MLQLVFSGQVIITEGIEDEKNKEKKRPEKYRGKQRNKRYGYHNNRLKLVFRKMCLDVYL